MNADWNLSVSEHIRQSLSESVEPNGLASVGLAVQQVDAMIQELAADKRG